MTFALKNAGYDPHCPMVRSVPSVMSSRRKTAHRERPFSRHVRHRVSVVNVSGRVRAYAKRVMATGPMKIATSVIARISSSTSVRMGPTSKCLSAKLPVTGPVTSRGRPSRASRAMVVRKQRTCPQSSVMRPTYSSGRVLLPAMVGVSIVTRPTPRRAVSSAMNVSRLHHPLLLKSSATPRTCSLVLASLTVEVVNSVNSHTRERMG